MSYYDGRDPHREYDYWTDERVRAHLESCGGVNRFALCDGCQLYGRLGPDGWGHVMDDDNDRAAAIIGYLKRIGAPTY